MLSIEIGANLTKFNQGIKKVGNRINQFTQKLDQNTQQLQSLSIPLLAFGAISLKLGADFDRAFTKINTLVGVSGDKLAELETQTKKLALETGVNATKAAEGLFFITSAGFTDATEASKILNITLKATALGLGETKDVAGLLTSALATYSEEGLSAGEASDVLHSAVRQGKLETEGLAPALSSVLAPAQSLGVSFQDLASSFAALSVPGTSASVAATQIGSLLSSIRKPADSAVNALNLAGISFTKIQDIVKEKGLLAGVTALNDAIEGTGVKLSEVITQETGLNAALTLTGTQAERAKEILEGVNDSSGSLEEAFAVLSESLSFKLDKALNSFSASLTDIGGALLPVLVPWIQKLSNFVISLTQWFTQLSAPMQKFIITLGVIIAALPGLILLLSGVGTALTAATGGISLLIAGIAALAALIIANWDTIVKETQILADKIQKYFVDIYNESLLIRVIVNMFKAQFLILKDYFVANFNFYYDVIANFIKQSYLLLKGLGNLLIGIFTLDTEAITDSFAMIGNAMKESFTGPVESAKKLFSDITESINERYKAAATAIRANPITIKVREESTATETDNTIPSATPIASTISGQTPTPALQRSIRKSPLVTIAPRFRFTSVKDLSRMVSKTLAAQPFDVPLAGVLSTTEAINVRSAVQRILDKKDNELKLRTKLGVPDAFSLQEIYKTIEDSYPDLAKKNSLFLAGFEELESQVSNAFKGIVDTIKTSVDTGIGFLDNLLKSVISIGGAIVQELLAQTTAKLAANLAQTLGFAIQGASQTAAASGPGAAVVLPVLIATAVGLVAAAFGAIPSFREGGIVFGSTLAMVGDNDGRGEVILPLDKLKNFIPQTNNRLFATITGDQLRIVLDRNDDKRNSRS